MQPNVLRMQTDLHCTKLFHFVYQDAPPDLTEVPKINADGRNNCVLCT